MPDPATIEAPAQPPGSQVPTTAALLAVAEATLRDLHPGASDLPPVLLSSVLDQDLGFDSLSRMELLLRTERAFGVDLPAETLQHAETVADVWQAVQRGLARRGAAVGAEAAGPAATAALAVIAQARPRAPCGGTPGPRRSSKCWTGICKPTRTRRKSSC